MNKIALVVVALVVATGGSFYAGLAYGRQSVGNQQVRSQQPGGFGGGNGQRGSRAMRAGGGFIAGEVLSKDDKTITLKLRAGGSKIIFVSNSTTITTSQTGSLGDVAVGELVSVTGASNSDGSVNAETIQVRPAIQFRQ